MAGKFPAPPYPELYAQEERIRTQVAEWLERDTIEGMEQYTRIIASMVGLKCYEDWPDAERLWVILQHPPMTPEGEVTPDIEEVSMPVPMTDPVTGQPVIDETGASVPQVDEMGQPVTQVVQPAVYPMWTKVAAEFPDYYARCCADAADLIMRFLEGTLQPKQPKAAEGVPA